MHVPLVFACAEPPVDRSEVKPGRQEPGEGSAALQCHLNATRYVLVLEYRWMILNHCLLDEVGEKPKIVHCIQAHRFALPCKVAIGTTALVRRTGPGTADAVGISLARDGGYAIFDVQFVIPPATHVVDVAEFPVPAKPEVRQGDVHASRPVQVGYGMHDALDVELEEVNPFSSHRHLKHAEKFME